MKIIVAMGHPAHYHLFRHLIKDLLDRGHKVLVVYTGKDILEELLSNLKCVSKCRIDRRFHKNHSLFFKGLKLLGSSINLFLVVRQFQPDMMVGCLSQIGITGRIANVKTYFVGEDDIDYTRLQAFVTYPFVDFIIAPIVTNVGKFNYKKIGYQGYQKLAYLHPDYFHPRRDYVSPVKDYFLIRLAKLQAYHDVNATGLSDTIVEQLIKILSPSGEIIISSEREVSASLKKYVTIIDKSLIHHYLSYARLYIGDSQSMAVEAAILGTPGIRFNSFVGKISVLRELEEDYKLAFGIHDSHPEMLFSLIVELLNTPSLTEEFKERANKMIFEKVDVNKFLLGVLDHDGNSTEFINSL